jgi:ribosome-associated protein
MSVSSIPETDAIVVSDRLHIPRSELQIFFTRSSGPGGQHVNKTSTRAELAFDLKNSPSIPENDRDWLLAKLASKLDTEGVLRIAAQEYRSQLRNKEAAIERLQAMLQEAIKRPKKRKKSKPTKSSKEARLKSKKRAGEIKKQRREKF